MSLLRGAIHWAHLDERRPVILISPDSRNELAGDVVVIPCSTAARPMSWHVALRRGEGGLAAASTAKCEQVTTVAKQLLEAKPLGRLSAARVEQLERALLLALGIVV